MSQVATNGPKVVKRYKNRKLYDTETSKYIKLGEIVDFIKGGREILVVENETKVDITGQTLLAALVETDEDAASQTVMFREILQAGGFAKYFAKLAGTKV